MPPHLHCEELNECPATIATRVLTKSVTRAFTDRQNPPTHRKLRTRKARAEAAEPRKTSLQDTKSDRAKFVASIRGGAQNSRTLTATVPALYAIPRRTRPPTSEPFASSTSTTW